MPNTQGPERVYPLAASGNAEILEGVTANWFFSTIVQFYLRVDGGDKI
jgi:hypothetical protein